MSIFIQHNGQQLGPFTEAEMKAQLASGAISLQDFAWWEGQTDWIPLGQAPFMGSTAPGAPPIFAPPVGTAGRTSKLAVWSLVCGCLSLFLSLFASIPAIILGHLSLREIKKNPGLQGSGLATAGLVMGYVMTVLLPFISIIAISVLIALGNQVKGTFKTINAQVQTTDTTGADSTTNSTATPATTNAAPASQ